MRVRQRRAVARSRQRGIAALEFALVMPILLVLLFGTIQYGLYFWAKQSASGAAREAVRRAAVGDLTCALLYTSVAGWVGQASAGPVATTRTYTPVTGTGAQVGGSVTVTISFSALDLNFPLLPDLTNGAITQEAESRVENATDDSTDCSESATAS